MPPYGRSYPPKRAPERGPSEASKYREYIAGLRVGPGVPDVPRGRATLPTATAPVDEADALELFDTVALVLLERLVEARPRSLTEAAVMQKTARMAYRMAGVVLVERGRVLDEFANPRPLATIEDDAIEDDALNEAMADKLYGGAG